jgi:hypothetical protein
MPDLSPKLKATVDQTAAEIAKSWMLERRFAEVSAGVLAVDNKGEPSRIGRYGYFDPELTERRAEAEKKTYARELAELKKTLGHDAANNIKGGASPVKELQELEKIRTGTVLLNDVLKENTLTVMARQVQSGHMDDALGMAKSLPEFQFGDRHVQPIKELPARPLETRFSLPSPGLDGFILPAADAGVSKFAGAPFKAPKNTV